MSPLKLGVILFKSPSGHLYEDSKNFILSLIKNLSVNLEVYYEF